MSIIPLPIREHELNYLAEIDASLEETARVIEAREMLSRFGDTSEEILMTAKEHLRNDGLLMKEYRTIFYRKAKSNGLC